MGGRGTGAWKEEGGRRKREGGVKGEDWAEEERDGGSWTGTEV